MPSGVMSNIVFRGHFRLNSNTVSVLHQVEHWTGIQGFLFHSGIGLLNDLEHIASLFYASVSPAVKDG